MPEWDTLVAGPEQTALASVDVAQVFAASYRKLVVQLYGIVGNASEAEDLVQEAFVRAYAAGPRFTRVDNPEAWLRTTAVNLYRNRWRKMRNFARIKHRLGGTTGPAGHRREHRGRRRPAPVAGEPTCRPGAALLRRPPGAPDRRGARDRRGHREVAPCRAAATPWLCCWGMLTTSKEDDHE